MATRQNQVNSNGHYRDGRHRNRVTHTEDVNHRDSREIQNHINETRGAMDETLDELGERLSPRNLLDDVIAIFRSPQTRDTAKRAGNVANDFTTNLGRQIRDNPIGASLVGAGLAWLALGSQSEKSQDETGESSRRRSPRDDYQADSNESETDPAYYTDDDLLLDRLDDVGGVQTEIVVPESYHDNPDHPEASNLRGTLQRAKAKTSAAASATGDACSSAWDNTKSTTSSAVDGVKSTASTIGNAVSSASSNTTDASNRANLRGRSAARDVTRGVHRVGRQARRQVSLTSYPPGEQLSRAYDAVDRRVERAHEEAPLALGLGVMALGAIAGALIPRTRREDELLGEASDEAIRQTRRQAEQAYERGQDAVEATVETAKQSAHAEGLTGESLAERATRVVEKSAGSISKTAKEEGLHPQQLKEDAGTVIEETKETAISEAEVAKLDAKAKVADVDRDAKKAMEN